MFFRDQLKILIISASNTWGLFLLVLLLGYGLVEVPRGMWQASNWPIRLAQTHFKLAKMSMEKQEAAEEFEDILEVCYGHLLNLFKCLYCIVLFFFVFAVLKANLNVS